MALFHHNVTCDQETEAQIQEKNISPSEAFRIGVEKMALLLPVTEIENGVKVEKESDISKLIRSRDLLQKKLLELQEDFDKIKNGSF